MMKRKRGGIGEGKPGEDAVCTWLVERGHVILDRNWHYGHLEIDIVSVAPDGIHFVEVKSRTAPLMAQPEENVGYRKQARIATAARRYLALRDDRLLGEMEVWLDVAAVTFTGEKGEITWFPGAYVPIHYG